MVSLSTEIWKSWECLFPFEWPAFGTMWVLAVLLFLGLKVALLLRAPGPEFLFWQKLSFLTCWPGMDVRPFTRRRAPVWPEIPDFLTPLLCLAGGMGAFFLAVHSTSPIAAGWWGMTSLILSCHFGAFHLLALALRSIGIRVKPIMGNPLRVTSLAQFWGGTWNRAFTDAVHPLVVRPLAKRMGTKAALVIAFVVSGLAHELVISVPANGGYGLPLLYFIIQGLGVVLERSLRGKPCQVSDGIAGRFYAALFVLAPAPILFHPPFLERVIHPFVHFLTKPGLLP